jgi:hypothetical protein
MSWACDWPDGGKQCGKPAEWYISSPLSDRPICTGCLAKVTPQPANHYSIEHIDPKRVPGPTYEPPVDPWAGMRTVHTSGFISNRPANPPPPPVNPMTPLDEAFAQARRGGPATPPGWRPSWERAEEQGPQPSRPPLKDAFADLASALLDLGLKKVDEWRKR